MQVGPGSSRLGFGVWPLGGFAVQAAVKSKDGDLLQACSKQSVPDSS